MTDELKRSAAMAAVDRLTSGKVLGLGSGSTMGFFVRELGRRLAEARLHKVVAVPTSSMIERLARESGVPLTTLEAHPLLDVTVDGADEVDPELNLLKGQGGALLREKIAAMAARRTVIVVDESKLASRLGERTPIPVEVVPFGWRSVAARLESLGGPPSLRMEDNGRPFLTDGGHYILDCAFGVVDDPHRVAAAIRSIVGVVEHGLFLGIAHEVIVGGPDGVITHTVESREGATAWKSV